jgi:uncharacterized protein DUF5996
MIPYDDRDFEILFDFVDHKLVLHCSDGFRRNFSLTPRSVAEFYADVMALLQSAGIEVKIWRTPVEIPDPISFDQDRVHASYDPDAAHRFWRILLSVQNVFDEFRAGFVGKCSPIHFFWGSFDLAVTRFSGRRAPERPGADLITREAYSHEVSSVGFWPGSGKITDTAFYCYAAPEPSGLRNAAVRPAAARYDAELGEFILMYEDVRNSANPSKALLEFCQSTYEAAATLAGWDRAALEREPKPALLRSA